MGRYLCRGIFFSPPTSYTPSFPHCQPANKDNVSKHAQGEEECRYPQLAPDLSTISSNEWQGGQQGSVIVVIIGRGKLDGGIGQGGQGDELPL
jgi:hypothetical protein